MCKRKRLLIIMTLMLTIMIDIMGMGLILPLFPDLFINPERAIVPREMTLVMRDVMYGVVGALWPLGLFFGSPYFGDMSDKISRKYIIFICLLATAITYFIAGYSVMVKSVGLFMLMRLLSGFFGGSFPIAQAMMIDMSNKTNKAKNLMLITLAASMGFLVGPIITVITTLPVFGAWFDLTSPFYIAGALSALNAMSVLFLLPATSPSNPGAKVHLFKGLLVIKAIFCDERIKRLLAAFLLQFFGWGAYCSVLALLVYQLFDYTSTQVAALYAVIAVGNILVTVFVSPWVFKCFTLDRICLVTGILFSLLIACAMITTTDVIQWVVALTAPGVQLLFYTAIMTMLSDAVDDTEQGKIMGGADSAVSFAFMFNSLMVGFLANVNILLPLLFASISIFIAALFFVKWK
jgi:MFS transporter, DHA1 family, tetracycline resistance protein